MLRYIVSLLIFFGLASGFDKFPKQFVFELPDNEDFCFYEKFDQKTAKDKYTVSFRVVRGGNNDVDFVIKSPTNEKVYEKLKQHYDEYQLEVKPGTYSFCFGNQFSTITHKQVFFSLNRNRPETLDEEAGATNVPSAMSLMQAKMENIHEFLSRVESMQSVHLVRESEGRSLSEDLNERVMLFSIMLAGAICVCGFGQVVILRTFFSDRKSVDYPRYPTARA